MGRQVPIIGMHPFHQILKQMCPTYEAGRTNTAAHPEKTNITISNTIWFWFWLTGRRVAVGCPSLLGKCSVERFVWLMEGEGKEKSISISLHWFGLDTLNGRRPIDAQAVDNSAYDIRTAAWEPFSRTITLEKA
jgi:hypothetical protein